MVVALRNVARAEVFFRLMGLKLVMGSCYIGVFISNWEAETTWLVGKVQGWTELVQTLSGLACKQPQSANTGLQKSFQQEWTFVRRVTTYIGETFRPVETALQDTFLLTLLSPREIGRASLR